METVLNIPDEVREKQGILLDFISKLGVDIEAMYPSDTSVSYKGDLLDLFLCAFIHKSYAADFKVITSHNERLEFLGDGVLGSVVCKLLFVNYPEMNEATMSLYKIALVREETLAEVAKHIGLDQMIFISKGEEKAGWREKDTILGDSFEALLGRMYCAFGEGEVMKFIETYLYPQMQEALKRPVKSYKSLVQEYFLKKTKQLPEYRIIQEGNLHFKAELWGEGVKVAEGTGESKKKAESEAARVFWTSING